MTLLTSDFDRGLAQIKLLDEGCRLLFNNPAFKKYGFEGICAIVARAKALNICPFQAVNTGFYIVSGKVGMSTEMMAALVRRAGHSVVKDPNSTPECVILHGKRADNGDIWTSKFTKEDAIVAGLWGGNTWKKYPETMLYNRAMSTLFRQLFPDLSLGAGYVPDEIDEITETGDYAPSKSEEKDLEIDAQPVPKKEEKEPLEILLQKLPEEKRKLVKDWISNIVEKDGYLTENSYKTVVKRIEATLKLLNESSASQAPEEILPY